VEGGCDRLVACDEFGRSVDEVGKVVDGGILPCCTMVWLRIFVCGWSKIYQFSPRPTGLRRHGSEFNHEKQPQLPSMAHQNITINNKKSSNLFKDC
jgi:hypothetical protein